MSQHTVEDLAQAVIARMDGAPNPRFKQIMTSLVTHLHAMVREVDLKPDEWMAAIQFLTATGQKCDAKRQEFILLSDTLGVSMLVVALDQLRGERAAKVVGSSVGTPATEATVQGPFYVESPPELPLGSDIGQGEPGEPAYYSGQVTDLAGKPIANCVLDVWSSDGDGFYDVQRDHKPGMHLRARFRTNVNGNYRFWSVKPCKYPVPVDGPVGTMLLAMGRHPFRPGHMHTMLQAPGYQRLTTHLFDSTSEYLDSDAVFGVRDSLIVKFGAHPPGAAPDGRMMKLPYHSANFDFKLVPAA